MHVAKFKLECIEHTFDNRFIHKKPGASIGNIAYDNDLLAQRLKEKKVKIIATHKGNRKQQPTQDLWIDTKSQLQTAWLSCIFLAS